MSTPWESDPHAKMLELVWPRSRWGAVGRRLGAISRMSLEKQCRLLRHHEDEAIADEREIAQRAAMDELIGVISLLEIAWMSRWASPQDFPQAFIDLAKRLLLSEAGLRYTVKHYRVELPTLALYRLQTGKAALETKRAANAAVVFEINRPRIVQYMNDPDTWEFLYFLDDFAYDDYDFDDLLADLSSPRKVAASLRFGGRADSVGGLSKVQRSAIRGAWSFISYCAGTSRAMQRLREGDPMLASVYWSFFSFWVDALSSEKDRFREVLRKLGQLKVSYFAGRGDDQAETEKSFRAALVALEKDLEFLYRSPRFFREPVKERAAELREKHKWLRPAGSL